MLPTAAGRPTETMMVEGSCEGRILVVEDEFFIGMLISEQLQELGYAVVGPALSIEEGRALANTAQIDGAILDWNLNGNNSGELADTLSRREIPLLFVTGYAALPDAHHRKNPILQKPFALCDLQLALQETLKHAEI
jgi:CheY-like chemotaxis protein